MTEGGASEFEALAADFVAELRRGGAGDLERVAAAHPAYAARIRELFPLLAMMEGLKPGASGAAPPPTSPAAPALPSRIGPYEIVRELGRGGMGRVFEARGEDGARVAIKLIHPHLADHPGYRARFLHEAQAGLRVRHAALVRTLGSGLHAAHGVETPYLVLEYAEGQTLHGLLLETGAVSERLAREVAAQVAEALAAVHAAGILHRDVKPENVVIAPDESVKLMDLGVALLPGDVDRLTRAGEFVGSLLYAAPEQLRGGPLDERTDLYAVGLLLYELVAGQHPDVGPPGTERPRLPRPGARRPLRDVVPDVSPFLDALVRALLAPDPAHRLASAIQVAKTLREGERSSWWRLEASAASPARRAAALTAFHGREREGALLDRLYGDVVQGEGRVLLLEGEAGIGKSRLLAEWLRRVDADGPDGPRTLTVRHEPDAEGLGLPPMAAALADELRGPDRRQRLERYLGPRGGLIEVLERHLDAEEGAPGPSRALPTAARAAAYVDLLRGLASERPLVVLFEDLHYASDDARAVYLLGARGLRREAVFVVASARPGTPGLWPEDLGASGHAHRHVLAGLDEEAALEVLRASMGAPPPSGSGWQDLVRNADGNPFCLLEYARERRQRADAAVAATAPGAASDLGVPRSLRALVEARLAALDDADRDLLSLAACAVDPFDPTWIGEAAGLPRLAGLRRLHQLHRRHGVLVPVGSGYRFQHHLVREVLHDELPPALRAAYHAALGEVLEARARAAPLQPMPRRDAYALVRHLLLGGAARRALPYAAAAVSHLHAERAYVRCVQVADAVRALGEELPPRDGAKVRLGRAMSLLAYAPLPEATKALEEAREFCTRFPDEEYLVQASMGLALAYRHSGRTPEALSVIEETVTRARAAGHFELCARAHGVQSLALAELGRLEEARQAAERGLDLAREHGFALCAAEISRDLGGIFLDRGRLEEARPLLEHSVVAAEFHGDSALAQSALHSLGRLEFLEGRVAAALEMTQRIVRLNQAEGLARMEAIARVNLAVLHGRLGEVEQGAIEARDALATARRMGFGDVAAHAHVSLGAFAEHRGLLTDAEDHFRAAVEWAEALGQPLLVARMGTPLARLLGITGRLAEARERLEGARRAAEGMGAPRELAHVHGLDAELREDLGEDEHAAQGWGDGADALASFGMAQEAAYCRLRQGQVFARLGAVAAAREALREARERVALAGPALPWVVEADLWLGSLPGGDPLVARQALELRDTRLGCLPWARAVHAFAISTQDAALLEAARARLEAFIAGAPAELRAPMRALPIHARLLG